jgi:predicted lipase
LVVIKKSREAKHGSDGSLISEPGFVALDTARSLIVVSFRGTSNNRDLLADLAQELADTPVCSSCQVHAGFNAEWDKRLSTVVAAVKTAKSKHPSFKLVLTGHSLGAAVATISGAYFRSVLKYSCDIYTYGSPRVGNDHFANFVSQTNMGQTYRVTHVDDPIPHLPPGGWLTGYYHTTPEYWLFTGMGSTDNYLLQDVKVCEGIDNGDCNGSTNLFAFDFTAHDNYFEDVSKCV